MNDFSSGVWRRDGEREVLVERIVSLDRRARTAERALRDLAEAKTGDIASGVLLAGYVARIVDLEDIIERLNQKITRRSA